MAIIRESETLNAGDDDSSSTPQDGFTSNGHQPDGLPDFNIIVGAPDLTALIQRRQTAKAREYRDKAASAFKAATIGSIHAGDFPDAATLLWHGPGAATAIGNLCDINSRIANAVDILTSPSSPLAECLLTMIPLISQLARNHEKQLAEIPSRWNMSRKARDARKQAKMDLPEPPASFTLKVGKRRIPVRWTYKPKLLKFITRGAMSQTQEPNLLAANVFTDPAMIRALEKMGIIIQQGSPNG